MVAEGEHQGIDESYAEDQLSYGKVQTFRSFAISRVNITSQIKALAPYVKHLRDLHLRVKVRYPTDSVLFHKVKSNSSKDDR